jgi:hypothetical protein
MTWTKSYLEISMLFSCVTVRDVYDNFTSICLKSKPKHLILKSKLCSHMSYDGFHFTEGLIREHNLHVICLLRLFF